MVSLCPGLGRSPLACRVTFQSLTWPLSREFIMSPQACGLKQQPFVCVDSVERLVGLGPGVPCLSPDARGLYRLRRAEPSDTVLGSYVCVRHLDLQLCPWHLGVCTGTRRSLVRRLPLLLTPSVRARSRCSPVSDRTPADGALSGPSSPVSVTPPLITVRNCSLFRVSAQRRTSGRSKGLF